jgi:hypothetical protein
MKQKLLDAKKGVSLQQAAYTLSKDDLKFITGGWSTLLSGAGSSSTSGQTCCDGTCLCH